MIDGGVSQRGSRDRLCLKTSKPGGSFRPYLQRLNFLSAISNVMPNMIYCTNFNPISTAEWPWTWTCLTDRIGAGPFDTPDIGAPAKHQRELSFALWDSPIAREIRSEIGRAKASFLETLKGAEVEPVSDIVQKSFLSVSDTGFGLRPGN